MKLDIGDKCVAIIRGKPHYGQVVKISDYYSEYLIHGEKDNWLYYVSKIFCFNANVLFQKDLLRILEYCEFEKELNSMLYFLVKKDMNIQANQAIIDYFTARIHLLYINKCAIEGKDQGMAEEILKTTRSVYKEILDDYSENKNFYKGGLDNEIPF